MSDAFEAAGGLWTCTGQRKPLHLESRTQQRRGCSCHGSVPTARPLVCPKRSYLLKPATRVLVASMTATGVSLAPPAAMLLEQVQQVTPALLDLPPLPLWLPMAGEMWAGKRRTALSVAVARLAAAADQDGCSAWQACEQRQCGGRAHWKHLAVPRDKAPAQCQIKQTL